MPSGQLNARKTHCPQGHEYTPENTRFQVKQDRAVERRSRYCKTCDLERMRRKRRDPAVRAQGAARTAIWRERHPDKYEAAWKAAHAEKKAILDEARRGGCVRCEESHPACLDFHHRDPSTKDADIATIRRFGVKRLLAEIAKCDVLCANCHRKHHYNERQ